MDACPKTAFPPPNEIDPKLTCRLGHVALGCGSINVPNSAMEPKTKTRLALVFDLEPDPDGIEVGSKQQKNTGNPRILTSLHSRDLKRQA